MDAAGIAAVTAATAALITAVGGVALTIPARRSAAKAVESIAEVHTMVNSQRTDMQRYTAALVDALTRAGVPVPADQSIEK